MLALALTAAVGLCPSLLLQDEAAPRVRVVAVDDTCRDVLLGELPFATYRGDAPPGMRTAVTPAVFPLLGPKGVGMTRGYPFAPLDGDPLDHPHQRSFWFAHGDVNGVNFWELKDGGPAIVHEHFEVLGEGEVGDTIVARNRWVDGEGRVIATDRRELRFFGVADDTLRGIDSTITIRAPSGELRFGDTKEGTLGFRMRPELALKGKGAAGEVIDSEGRRGAAVWGKRARWIAYFGPIDGKPLGFALMDHPRNLRHPTWWHARDYGLAAANPFGQHDFESVSGKPGEYVLEPGAALTFRHRLVLFEGEADPERIDAWWREFAATGADETEVKR